MSEASTIPGGEIAVYQAADGAVRVEARLERDRVWLTQAQMAELFGRERSVITKHIPNLFREGELAEESNVQNLHIAGSDKPVACYNLDVIISVGYCVKSLLALTLMIDEGRPGEKDILVRLLMHLLIGGDRP